MDQFRICKNEDCEHAGIAQPIENFSKRIYKDKKYHSNQCRDCEYKKNRKRWFSHAYTTKAAVSPLDDPETDLMPMESGGFVRWAVISNERRREFGEKSPFNGLSIDMEDMED